jgi:import inner membrane translocase subunit TIM21
MLRQVSAFGLRQSSRLKQSSALRRLLPIENGNAITMLHLQQRGALSRQLLEPLVSTVGVRSLSSKANEEPPKTDNDDPDTKEIVLTPGQKVAAASRLTMWTGIFGFACVCAYFIGKELIPTKMSPNRVFNVASKAIKANSQVSMKYGATLKFYGKDHGGHREGRRNFIEHTQYNDEGDGSKRTRVRFNMEGQFDSAICFAEVSNEMSSGEFVYVLVQDKRSGRVITVIDNRAALTAKKLAGGNQETANAMQQLLGGNSK